MNAITAQEIIDTAHANAKATFLIDGGDMEKAIAACEASHQFPELSAERVLYVGAYIDTIRRLRTK